MRNTRLRPLLSSPVLPRRDPAEGGGHHPLQHSRGRHLQPLPAAHHHPQHPARHPRLPAAGADHRGPDPSRDDGDPHPHPAGRGPGKHHSPDSSGDAARSSGLAGGDPDHPWPQKPVSTAILGAIPVTTISGQRVGSPVTPGQTVTARTPQRKGMDSRALRPKEELDLWEIRAFSERSEGKGCQGGVTVHGG